MKSLETVPGGAPGSIFPVKSDCDTDTSKVIWSSPETKGLMVTDKSAFTDL